jgi:hypothetical protein
MFTRAIRNASRSFFAAIFSLRAKEKEFAAFEVVAALPYRVSRGGVLVDCR